MLEWKRIQLENEEKDQKMVQDARTTLTQNIRHIQLDLRDLISQVSTQVSTVFLLKSTHISSSPFPVEEGKGDDDQKWSDIRFVLLSPLDELFEKLLEKASSCFGTNTPEPSKQVQDSMGQPSGRLHHPEGSGPLPHQAGKRLSFTGYENTVMTQN